MEARVKSQVMTFFKIGGFNLRSEVAILLVDKIKELDEEERKVFIGKIFSSIQNQILETASIEQEHMKTAIRVRLSSGNCFVEVLLNLVFFRSAVKIDSATKRKQSSVL